MEKSKLDKRVIVAVALVIDSEHRVLMAKRGEHQHQAGLWEFPGGKVESDETLEQAMIRELKEEVGVEAISFKHFHSVEHDYHDKHVLLESFLVREHKGLAKGLEGQPVKWVPLSMLKSYEVPEANKMLVSQLLSIGSQ